MTDLGSRQISCVAVYQLLLPVLGEPDIRPGSPEWQQLDDADPRKWQAIFWAALMWAVSEDAYQEALTQASKSIAAATDWGAVGQPRPPSYIPRTLPPAPVSGRLSRCEPR